MSGQLGSLPARRTVSTTYQEGIISRYCELLGSLTDPRSRRACSFAGAKMTERMSQERVDTRMLSESD